MSKVLSIKFSKFKKSPISINLILSNNRFAKGLKYADQFRIKKQIFNFKDYRKTENKMSVLLKNENTEVLFSEDEIQEATKLVEIPVE